MWSDEESLFASNKGNTAMLSYVIPKGPIYLKRHRPVGTDQTQVPHWAWIAAGCSAQPVTRFPLLRLSGARNLVVTPTQKHSSPVASRVDYLSISGFVAVLTLKHLLKHKLLEPCVVK